MKTHQMQETCMGTLPMDIMQAATIYNVDMPQSLLWVQLDHSLCSGTFKEWVTCIRTIIDGRGRVKAVAELSLSPNSRLHL